MNILILIYADPRLYISIMSMSHYFSNKYLNVDIICLNEDTKDKFDVLDFGKTSNIFFFKKIFFLGILDLLFFLFFSLKKFFKNRANVIFAFDKRALIVSMIISFLFNKKVVYVNFDFDFEKKIKISFSEKILRIFELFLLKYVDLIITPQKERSKILQSKANLKNSPETLSNCYSKYFFLQKKKILKKILYDKNINYDKIVVRLGHLAPHHALPAIIQSFKKWHGNPCLVLGGFSLNSYDKYLKNIINDLGLSNKIIVLENISYSLWFDILSSADIGICLYDEVTTSHKFMSESSQKLNNYLMAGIPSIVNNSLDFINFITKHKAGIEADPKDSISIANSINILLDNDNVLKEYKLYAKEAFLSFYNFEDQFDPIFYKINSLFKNK
jgi:glycosyltransferase involved in cell wall biosynthesis